MSVTMDKPVRVRRKPAGGLLDNAGQGIRNGGHAPYGYHYAPSGALEIEPEAATVVRLVYELYIAGQGYLTVARELDARGIPSPAAKRWNPAVVRRAVEDGYEPAAAYLSLAVRLGAAAPYLAAAQLLTRARESIPVSRSWSPITVRNILMNPLYCGYPDYELRADGWLLCGGKPGDVISAYRPDLAIVTTETWETAQVVRRSRQR